MDTNWRNVYRIGHEVQPYTATCPGCNQDAEWVSHRQQWSDSGHDYPPAIFINCERCGNTTVPTFPSRQLTEKEIAKGLRLCG